MWKDLARLSFFLGVALAGKAATEKKITFELWHLIKVSDDGVKSGNDIRSESRTGSTAKKRSFKMGTNPAGGIKLFDNDI